MSRGVALSLKFKMKLSATPVGFKMWAMRNLDIVTVTKPTKLVQDLREIINDAQKRYTM